MFLVYQTSDLVATLQFYKLKKAPRSPTCLRWLEKSTELCTEVRESDCFNPLMDLPYGWPGGVNRTSLSVRQVWKHHTTPAIFVNGAGATFFRAGPDRPRPGQRPAPRRTCRSCIEREWRGPSDRPASRPPAPPRCGRRNK